ncbi:hypothetical protein K7432_004313 [Basidiobolus ranarum]|uniref:Uncharacterized protein n=1 Tax=Basidiobolus ranarum TaxID=34480 RepID=A0ABR2W4U7_9FUNG
MFNFLTSITILAVLINFIESACFYATDPGWYATSKYHYQLSVCPTQSESTILSTITFPSQYKVETSPSECKPNGDNSFECNSSGDFMSFDLFTPDNLNGKPSVTVLVEKELCEFATSCSAVSSKKDDSESKDNGMISLGPFGTYPKPAAIGGLCAFCCVILIGSYLVYRRSRMYSRRRSDEPTERRNLWQWVCGSSRRQTGSRFNKRNVANSKKMNTGNVVSKRNLNLHLNLEEGNSNLQPKKLDTLPLERFSINELGSGVKNIPSSSVLLNLDDAVQKPSLSVKKTTHVRREPSTKIRSKVHEAKSTEKPTSSKTMKRTKAAPHPIEDKTEHSSKQHPTIATSSEQDKSHPSTAKVSRSKTTRDNVRSQNPAREPQRSSTTKRNNLENRRVTSNDDDKPLSRNKSIKSSQSYDSDNTPLKLYKSKSVSTKPRKIEVDERSIDSKDNTPLGLIGHSKSVNVSKPTSNVLSNSQPDSPGDDDLPLLHPTLIKLRAAQENTLLRDSNGASTSSKESSVEDLHYSEEIFDMYKNNHQ